MVYIKQACFARQNLLPNNSFLVIQLTYSVKKFEVVKKSEKVEEVQKSRVTDVEQVLTGRYSSQRQFSPLGELEPGVVGGLVGKHFSKRTGLRIFLIFCTELDIDK